MSYRSWCLKGAYVFALIGALLLQAGCAGNFSKPKVPSVIAVPSPTVAPSAGTPSTYPVTGNYTLANYLADLASYGDGTGANALKIRNKMVYSISAEIDYAFYDYETKLFLNEGQFHVGADFVQLGLAAASTVSIGARGKTILGALLTGVTGMNLSIDKNFFQQQTVQAIASSMEANRDQIKTTILKQLTQDTTAYPFTAARADLIRYFFAGTLIAGLQKLGQTAATDAKTSKAGLTYQQVKPAPSFTAVDIQCVEAVNSAIAAGNKINDQSKAIAFLRALNVTIADDATGDDVLNAIRPLGRKAGDDTALRAQYCAAAQKSGLINVTAVAAPAAAKE